MVVAVALMVVAAACGDSDDDSVEAADCVRSESGSSWWSVTRELGLDPASHWRGVRDLHESAHPPDRPDVLLPGYEICLTDSDRELVLAFAVDGDGDDGDDGEAQPGGETTTPPEDPQEKDKEKQDEEKQDEKDEQRPVLDDLVPPSLIATERQSLDPSLEKFIDRSSLLELAWEQVTGRWKTAKAVDLVDKTLVCIYKVDAGSIGIYGGLDPARTVAVGVIIPDRVASIDFALCLARTVVEFNMIGPPDDREPQVCGSAYEVETVDGTAYVAYATAGYYETDRDPCAEICAELPGCADAARE